MKTTLRLQIGSHNFSVKVAERDKSATLNAARKVDKMLEAKRSSHNVVDNEYLALMVALELALSKGGGKEDGASDASPSLGEILDEGLELVGKA